MATATTTSTPPRKPFYKILYVQVLIAIAIGIMVGHVWPTVAVELKPLGDGFIKLIKMVIALVIFCTVVSGISGMESMKKVGRIGGKALLYFEVVSTLALAIGLVVGNWLRPGAGFNANPATLDAKAVDDLCRQGAGADGHRVPAERDPEHGHRCVCKRRHPACRPDLAPVRMRAGAAR